MKLKTTLLIVALTAFAFGMAAHATVTPQAWYHFGDGGVPIPNDSTANNNTFNAVYYGTSGATPLVGPNAVGGPLGDSGYTSTSSARFGLNGSASIDELFESGTFNPATTNYYVPPATNYGIEAWFLPQNKGYVSDGTQGAFTPIFSSGGSIYGAGPGGGAAVLVIDNLNGTYGLQAAVVHQGDSAGAFAYFGPEIPVDTNHWIHLALVNDNGTLTFYTNGVPCATNDNSVNPLTAPAGTLFVGRDGGHVSIDGYLDELRVFTFAPGAFSVSDLLYSPSPRMVIQPQNTAVWNGGAANFAADVSVDPGNTFQWYQNGSILSGQTAQTLNLDTVASGDSGNLFSCLVTNGNHGLVTSNAALTVVPVQTANVAVYRNAVTSESSLIGYFPGDGSTGTTLANTVDGTHDGILESGAVYDGQTNRSFGERAVYLQGNGNVQIPSDTSYEFSSGNGTIEALVYLMPSATGQNGDIFSVASTDGSGIRYALGATADGTALIYTNDAGVSLTWAAPVSLLNRFVHVALVFSGTTSVTAYLDGQSLGTKTQSGFGAATGVPEWIGSLGSSSASWNGTIDEVAIYSSALSANTIAIHDADFIYGTNTSGPSITGQSASKTIYAGGSPVLSVTVSGTPPFSYQWQSNGVPISGATDSTLLLPSVTTNATAAYTVTVKNSFSSTNNNSSPINLTVVSPPTGYAAAVMQDDPSAFWQLADSSGPVARDSAGFNDGTYNSSGVTYNAGGPPSDPGSGVAFDGAAGRVVVPYSPVLNPSGPFTIEFWAKPAAYNFYSPISSMVRPARSGGYEFYLAGNYAGYEFHTAAGGGYNMITGSSTAPAVGAWHHVAGVWDGTHISLYVDGYLIGTSTNPPFTPNPSTPFYIGSRSDGAAYFDGTMSDVAFYNYALTQSQLQKHVGAALPLALSITASTNVVADSKPSGIPFNGFNNGASWVASQSDGTTTRTGVMNFVATNNDQVTVPPYADLVNDTNGTIMFWMRSSNIVTSSGSGNQGTTLFQWRNGNGGCAFYQDDSGAIGVQSMNNYCHFVSTANITDGKWHHIAFTYDQSPFGGITCYIDGVQDSSAYNSQAWYWSPTAFIEVGEDLNDGWWQNYNGSLDDVRIYNRILTPTEISQAMNGAVVDSNALQMRLDFNAPPAGYSVSWPYGSVQVAPSVNGTYTTITNVSSPYPAASASASQQFYRGVR